MDLKNLANKAFLASQDPLSLIEATDHLQSTRPSSIKWVVIISRLLHDEEILLVMHKKHLKDARKAHPAKVIYFLPEVEELLRHKHIADFQEYVKSVHAVKKKFKGWIVPSDDSPPEADIPDAKQLWL